MAEHREHQVSIRRLLPSMDVIGVTSFARQREQTPCFAVASNAREYSHALSLSVAVWARQGPAGRSFTCRGGCAAACRQARRYAGRIPATTTESEWCRNSRSGIPARARRSACSEERSPVTAMRAGTLLFSIGECVQGGGCG